MLNTIDTVIAFAVIMTVLSVLITIIVQMVSAAFSLRGKNLANALALTFQTIDPTIGDHAHSLANQILRDPIFSDSMWRKKSRTLLDDVAKAFIEARRRLKDALTIPPDNLMRPQAVAEANDAVDIAKAKVKPPAVKPNRMKPWGFWTWPWGGGAQLGSAIRPGEIYRVLCDIAEASETEAAVRDIPPELVQKASGVIAVLRRWDRPAIESREKLASIAYVSKVFDSPEQQQTVLNSLADFGATVERATTHAYDRFQRWFGSAQDRAEQWFQMHVRIVTIVFSILVAFFLQLDTVEMFHMLRVRPRLADALTQSASGVLEIGRSTLDPTNTPAYASYQLWLKKHPHLPLPKLPSSGTADGYHQAIATRLQEAQAKGSISSDQAASLLADYHSLRNEGAEEFLRNKQETVRSLKEALVNTEFDLAPASFFGRWDNEDKATGFVARLGQFWRHLFGVLLTAGLLTLGAPFWFNLLKNLSSLRPAVATLIEKRPTSAPALPPAPEKPSSQS